MIEQYQNERQVEYVFDASTYQLWIDNAEEPLRSASTLARNSGITRVEMLNLEKDCVILRNEADEEGNWGDLIIKRGLSGGRANACSRSTKNQSRSSNISSPNPNVATSSANHVTLTDQIPPGFKVVHEHADSRVSKEDREPACASTNSHCASKASR